MSPSWKYINSNMFPVSFAIRISLHSQPKQVRSLQAVSVNLQSLPSKSTRHAQQMQTSFPHSAQQTHSHSVFPHSSQTSHNSGLLQFGQPSQAQNPSCVRQQISFSQRSQFPLSHSQHFSSPHSLQSQSQGSCVKQSPQAQKSQFSSSHTQQSASAQNLQV